jgi:hypothetical protein
MLLAHARVDHKWRGPKAAIRQPLPSLGPVRSSGPLVFHDLDADELREWPRDRTDAQPRARATAERVAEAKVVVPFVELHGDSPEELAAAVEALLTLTKAD